MPRILSQAGSSMAQGYDVDGGIVGVDELDSAAVHLAEDFGARVFSERLQSFLIRMTSGAINQSIDFDILAAGIPDSVNRILGIFVFETNTRIDNVQVGWNEQEDDQDMPLFVWNTATDSTRSVRYEDLGTVAAVDLMVPAYPMLTPTIITRTGANRVIPQLVMRGSSTAFGAGTVVCNALVHLCRANPGSPAPGEPSSHGLPLPGW